MNKINISRENMLKKIKNHEEKMKNHKGKNFKRNFMESERMAKDGEIIQQGILRVLMRKKDLDGDLDRCKLSLKKSSKNILKMVIM